MKLCVLTLVIKKSDQTAPDSELLRVAYCDVARYFTIMIILVFPVIGGGIVRKTQMVTDRELEIMKVLWARGRARCVRFRMI